MCCESYARTVLYKNKNKLLVFLKKWGCIQCLWVCSLSFAVPQMCVWSVDTCAHIKLTFGRLYQARHILSSLHSGVVLS